MSEASVALRRCPDCGTAATGRPGLEWLVCPSCPTVFDPFSTPVRRVATFTLEEAPDRRPHLPLYRFRIEGDPRACTLAWVAGCRIAGIQNHGDPGARLTERRADPRVVPAPLRARLARGPGEAWRLLAARHGWPVTGGPRATEVVLVGFPLDEISSSYREKVTGLSWPRACLRPDPLELPREG
jgi:hypothetical protein